MKTLILAHYYTTPEVQALAHYVGDSLDLALHAQREKADRIVFAGVRFMAETAKILNPEAEVILPDGDSTCSLVTQTDIEELRAWLMQKESLHRKTVHIAYINSSADHKALADVIVTSRNVAEIVGNLVDQGYDILFSPDRNMGAYLKHEYPGWPIEYWSAVCEVHDKFKVEELDKVWRSWADGRKVLLAHPESPLPVLERADYVGSTHGMLNWVKAFPYDVGTIYVATEEGLLHNMRELRPGLVFKQAPTYTGCQCNQCPYMKLNTQRKVFDAAMNGIGSRIDYLSDLQIKRAYRPIERMLEFQKTGEVNV